MDQLILTFVEPPTPTLDNFVVGRNAEAVEALRELADGRSPHRLLYLWGEPGSGRSHLLSATAEAARERGRQALVVADDVESLDEATQHQLFTTALEALAGEGELLVSGGLPPASLGLREDLRSRLGAGLVLRLLTLSDEEKLEALSARARHLGVALGDDVTRYMLRHCPRDMGSLFSTLDALDRASVKWHRPVTVALLRECLNEKP